MRVGQLSAPDVLDRGRKRGGATAWASPKRSTIAAAIALMLSAATGCHDGETEPAPPDAGQDVRDGGSDAGGSRDASFPVVSDASWLIQSGDSVFFVGNSFFDTSERKLAEWVPAIGQAVQPPFVIHTGSHIVPGNQPLSWFYDQPESQEAIASGRYQMFVLQGEEHEPAADRDGFHQAVRDYHRAITAQGGKVMLFMTWGFIWDDAEGSYFQDVAEGYEQIGRELDIPIIPVGLIYADCNEDPYGDERPYWLMGQEDHQTETGSAVNAYATFAMLTGINPMGRPFVATGNTNSPALLQYLSDKAWARVAVRLRVGQ